MSFGISLPILSGRLNFFSALSSAATALWSKRSFLKALLLQTCVKSRFPQTPLSGLLQQRDSASPDTLRSNPAISLPYHNLSCYRQPLSLHLSPPDAPAEDDPSIPPLMLLSSSPIHDCQISSAFSGDSKTS